MSIENNLEQVRENIKNAAQKVNRDINEITLIAVTKTKPIEDVKEAVEANALDVGENKVQEIRDKYAHFDDQVNWHMIGHLQTNKVKYIADKVCMIHSVDSYKLGNVIDKESKKHNIIMDVLVQVMVVPEESKHGVQIDDLEGLLRELSTLMNIRVRGLMTVPPFVADPEENREAFKKLREILIDMNLKNIDNINMDVLSMGMTNDYKVAIEEGATMVRVGTAIFGRRNYKKGLN